MKKFSVYIFRNIEPIIVYGDKYTYAPIETTKSMAVHILKNGQIIARFYYVAGIIESEEV